MALFDSGNDPQTVELIRKAARRMDDLAQEIAVELYRGGHNKQRSCSITISGMMAAATNALNQHSRVVGAGDVPADQLKKVRLQFSEIANAEIIRQYAVMSGSNN
jgi:hypothetical protein